MNRKKHTYSGCLNHEQLQSAGRITRFITSKYLRRLGLVVCMLVVTLLTVYYTAAASFDELRLEYIPWQNPVATYVRVNRQGNAQALRYIRSRLLAVEALEGKLSSQATSNLFAKRDRPAFKTALLRQSFAGNGAIEGDLFNLITIAQDKQTERIFGLVHLTPKEVSSAIDDLLATVKHLRRVPLAVAYLTSEQILPKQRLAQMRSQGVVKKFGALPQGLQQILQPTIDSPLTFTALGKKQYQQFLSYKTGSELLVDKQGDGYQIYLLTTNTNQ